MELDRTKKFWMEEAEEAKKVAEHLFEKKELTKIDGVFAWLISMLE